MCGDGATVMGESRTVNVEAYRAILKRLGVEPVAPTTVDDVAPPPSPCHASPPASAPVDPVTADLAHLLPMPLDCFAREGQPIEIRVRWWPETLFFVPSPRDAEALCREGIGRARIWTAGELTGLLSASPLTTAALLTVMRAREMFAGEVVEARPR
jgi:hypothetical protein